MATWKRLSLICELPSFANAYLGKVTKFQGYSLLRSGVLSNLQAWRWKTPPLPGMNRVKNSTNLVSSLAHMGVKRATSFQTFDFSTLYISIPHDLLKSRMNYIINNAFKYKNGATRYTHIKVGRNKRYFTSYPLNGDNKYNASDICKMIEFLVDNIYVRFGEQLFRQMVWHSYGNKLCPIAGWLVSLFLCKEGKRKLARKFNLPSLSIIKD